MLRLATSWLSPGGTRGRLSAFIFHRVLAAPDPLQPGEPDVAQFDAILDWIGSQFDVLPPLEACERLYALSLPPRAAIITFDDGYRDNHDIALPLLQKHRMPAAFFIATGYLEGGTMFNDRVIEALRHAGIAELDGTWLGLGVLPVQSWRQRLEAIDRLLASVKHMPPARRLDAVARIEDACGRSANGGLMMSEAQVGALAKAGMEIGGHTRNHPILRALPPAEAMREIEGGRDDLKAITSAQPILFAYPNGKAGDDFDGSHRAMVANAGFQYAFTTEPGATTAAHDRFLIRRHTPWSRAPLRFGAQALRNLLRDEPGPQTAPGGQPETRA